MAKMLSHPSHRLNLRNPSQRTATQFAHLPVGAAKSFLHRCQVSTMCCFHLALARCLLALFFALKLVDCWVPKSCNLGIRRGRICRRRHATEVAHSLHISLSPRTQGMILVCRITVVRTSICRQQEGSKRKCIAKWGTLFYFPRCPHSSTCQTRHTRAPWVEQRGVSSTILCVRKRRRH